MKLFLEAIAVASLGVLAVTGAPAFAQEQEQEGDITLSGRVTIVSDYRFRGVSQTGGDPALQASVTVNHASGFYGGLWASTVHFDKFGAEADAVYGNAEVDMYAGWSGEVAPGLTADAGLLYYFYPDGAYKTEEVFEPYASLPTTLGPANVKLGATYGWKQASLGGIDNLQVYTDVAVGIPSTPLTVQAHLAYIDGTSAAPRQAGTGDRTAFDYSLGVSATMRGFTLGLSYIGSEGPNIDRVTDDAVVASLSYGF